MANTKHAEGTVADLALAVRRLAEAASPSEVFRAIHEACFHLAPAHAIFLVRRGELCGWNGAGYPAEILAALRAFRTGLDPGLLGGSERPSFGQPAAAESLWTTVETLGRPIACVLAERGRAQGPWQPEGLRLLATVARMRLDLDVLRRKLETAAAAEASVAEPQSADVIAPTTAGSGSHDVASPFAPPGGALAPAVAEIDVAAAPDTPALAAARRYARLVATDIRLYHEDAVVLGQRDGDLARRLGDQLELGRQTFLRRHPDLGATGLDVLRDAYVTVLAGGKAELIPKLGDG